ncbi:MAG: hypothetical protein GF405_08795 [Candidatus Eisenbacteria bacterium]|nr:hypothetical protein [Candidatus Eisenbacteria bacterium]
MRRPIDPRRFVVAGLLLSFCIGGCGRPDVDYPNFIRDKMVAVTIAYGVMETITPELSGVQPGDIEGRADCPHGGSLTLQGTFSAGAALDEFDLALTASSCKLSGDFGFFAATTTISGQLTLDSSWNRFDGRGSDVLRSDELRIRADTDYQGHTKPFDRSCAFDYHMLGSATSDALFGTLCSKPYAASLNHRG